MTPRVILLDVEGTTSSISFVHETMFPYVLERIAAFLENAADNPDVSIVAEDVLREAGQAETPRHVDLHIPATRKHVASAVQQLMRADAKVTGLKRLQGMVWDEGFRSGELLAHVYPDVPTALRRWHALGLQLSIYSSGSVQAQQLFFGHTIAGNLRSLLTAHFDTQIGGKKVATSYAAIARAIGHPADAICFVSDVVAELDAARTAGLRTICSQRPGNAPIPQPIAHPVVTSFDQIDPLLGLAAPHAG